MSGEFKKIKSLSENSKIGEQNLTLNFFTDNDESFEIQFIMQSRMKFGQVSSAYSRAASLFSNLFLEQEELFVVWRGFPVEEATWQHEDTLINCRGYQRAIKQFRDEQKERKGASSNRILNIDLNDFLFTAAHQLYLKQKKANELVVDDNKDLGDGFDRGLTVEKILGASNCDGNVVFCVKWAGTDEADNVLHSRLKKHAPQQLAEFLSSRVVLERSDWSKKSPKRGAKKWGDLEEKLGCKEEKTWKSIEIY